MRFLLSLFALAITQMICAQNLVTFQVNMNEYTGSYTTVNLNGVFNGWCGECAPMSDDDADGIYTIEVDIPLGQIEYKFTLDGWTEQEIFTPGAPCTLTSGEFTNRVANITGPMTMDVVCWEGCADCGSAPLSADVTFQVDMNEFTGSFTTVNLNGTFNNWCGGCAEMTDADEDGIYEITANILTGVVEYKFTIDGWGGEEILSEGLPCTTTIDGFTNRSLEVTEDTTLPAVCWEDCVECPTFGIDEATSTDFSIHPNPSNGMVQIAFDSPLASTNGSVSIFDLSGKMIERFTVASLNGGQMDLSEFSEGVYMVTFQNTHSQTTQRLTIKH